MCGIVYAQSLDGSPVNQIVWDQFDKQRLRGTEGFGLWDGKHTVKAAMEKRIKRWFKRSNNDTTMLLFHHRFPTSTVNVKRAAHPFNTGNYFGDTRYVLVHNGVISNPKELKEEHEKLGITYQSVLHDGKFNDSEALLWDMALTLEGKQEKMNAYGGIAFICIKIVNGKPEKMYFGRNHGRPLNLDRNELGIMLSSEGPGEEIEVNKMYTYNYELNRLTNKHFSIPSYKPYVSGDDDDYYGWEGVRAKWNSNNSYHVPGRRNYQTHLPYADYGYADDDRPIWDWDYDYTDENGYPAYTPRSVSSPSSIGDLIGFKPTPTQTYAEMMRLLTDNDGFYHQAYWQAENEYADLENILNPNMNDLRKMEILMATIDRFFEDPSYRDESSVHIFWQKDDNETREELVRTLVAAAAEVA